MAFFDAVLFHERSGSLAALRAVAGTGKSVAKVGSAAKAESKARRLTAEKEGVGDIIGSFQTLLKMNGTTTENPRRPPVSLPFSSQGIRVSTPTP
jgi:hypothetical protein